MTEEDEAFEQIEKAQGWRKRQIEMKKIRPNNKRLLIRQKNKLFSI